MTKEYVLLACTRKVPMGLGEFSSEILLILKDRPLSQIGKLNLIGGGIEDGESPEFAAEREAKEETGLSIRGVEVNGILRDRSFVIHCCTCKVDDPYRPLTPRKGETEKPMWKRLDHAIYDDRLMPNLRVIIPLLTMEFNGVFGWEITSDSAQQNGLFYDLKITLPLSY